jgi:hypothetical protein
VPSFEFALRERTARLMIFRHAYYARVRRVDRMPAPGGLALVSDHVEGTASPRFSASPTSAVCSSIPTPRSI